MGTLLQMQHGDAWKNDMKLCWVIFIVILTKMSKMNTAASPSLKTLLVLVAV